MYAFPFSHHAVGHVSFAASQPEATLSTTLVVAVAVAAAGAGVGLIVVCLRAMAARPRRQPLIADVAATPVQPVDPVGRQPGDAPWRKGMTEAMPLPTPPPHPPKGVAPTVPMPHVPPARTMRTPVAPSVILAREPLVEPPETGAELQSSAPP